MSHSFADQTTPFKWARRTCENTDTARYWGGGGIAILSQIPVRHPPTAVHWPSGDHQPSEAGDKQFWESTTGVCAITLFVPKKKKPRHGHFALKWHR